MMDLNKDRRDIVNELHKQARKHFSRRRVIMKGIDNLWQADLVEMISYAAQNNGYRYLLTVIDTFSKKAWAMAVKKQNCSKTWRMLWRKFLWKVIAKPKNLQTDDGKEFFNNQISSNWCKSNRINHYSTKYVCGNLVSSAHIHKITFNFPPW